MLFNYKIIISLILILQSNLYSEINNEYNLIYIGTKKLINREHEYAIQYFKVQVDYNTIFTNSFWEKINCPEGTVNSYVGRYTEIWHCEHINNGSIMYDFWGIDFINLSEYKANPGPGKVRIRWFIEYRQNDFFINNNYYIFCFNQELKEEWLNLNNEPSCDIDNELDVLNAIIEIDPLFEISQEPTFPKTITKNNILSYRNERHLGDKYLLQYKIEKTKNNLSISIYDDNCAYRGKDKTFDYSFKLLNMLLYTINTIEWKKIKKMPDYKINPPVTRSYIEYITENNSIQELLFEYESGIWYMKDSDNNYWKSFYPDLLYNIEDMIINEAEKSYNVKSDYEILKE